MQACYGKTSSLHTCGAVPAGHVRRAFRVASWAIGIAVVDV